MYNEELNKQQRYDEHGGCFTAFSVVFFIIVSMLVLIGMFCGCKGTEKVVTRVEYRDSVINRTEYIRDSVYVSDSVRIKEKGDTVLIERWKVIYKDKLSEKTDTIYIDKVRTETETETVTKKVVPKWCWWLLVVCAIVGTYEITKIVFKLKKL